MAPTRLESPMPSTHSFTHSFSSSAPAIDTSIPVQEIPVLIVGAGPVGLFEALLLTKMGIRVRIIDRDPHISPFSRAQGTHARTLEILAMVEDGFIDKFMSQGEPLQEAHMYYGSRRMCTLPFSTGGVSRYEQPLFTEQEKLSKVLAKELEAMGVPVEFGWELVDTEVVESVGEESYVKTVIRQTIKPENGEREHQVIRSEYLVGSDGGRSTVRHKLNIKFPGRTLPNKSIMFDGIVDTDLEMKNAVTITGVNQKTLLIFGMSDNAYRVIVEVDDFTPDEDLDQINREACLHPETRFNVIESRWLTCYRVNERRAETYNYKDRILLAGDAAHVHSPAGGQGMNTGLQDAHNLAWKLALVLNKLAPPTLLQTYQDERMPMADRAIALSSKILAGDTDQGAVHHCFRRLFLLVSPLLMYIDPTAFPRMLSMLEIRYPANSINQPHKSQAQPKNEEHQVGARAPDGPLDRLSYVSEDLSSLDNDTALTRKEQCVYVQELTVGVGRFHILVLAGNSLSDKASFKAREEALAQRMKEHAVQWSTRWQYPTVYGSNTDSQLFKIHVIATGTMSEDHQNGLLAQRAQGDGRLFWDSSAAVHTSYGVSTQAKGRGRGGANGMDQGAIVVIRPDSHIGFRVQGVDKAAWADVTEYFEAILA
ncbi:hypothetical protein MVEG_04424 [Podila verticillata NRRL 6337]|nr:hypothetical protein MVEG_04424 [Podila verticillata NRRL 6337]